MVIPGLESVQPHPDSWPPGQPVTTMPERGRSLAEAMRRLREEQLTDDRQS